VRGKQRGGIVIYHGLVTQHLLWGKSGTQDDEFPGEIFARAEPIRIGYTTE